jgi:hypothetical protein
MAIYSQLMSISTSLLIIQTSYRNFESTFAHALTIGRKMLLEKYS